MVRSRSTLIAALVSLAAFAPVVAACGGDDGTSPADNSIVLSDPTVMTQPTAMPFSVITPAQGIAMMEADPSIVLIDVRTPDEYAQGHIDGAINLDVESGTFEDSLGDLAKDGRYIVYCRSGNRSAAAMRTMRDAGFDEVYDMGGLQAWMAAGNPIVAA